MTHVIPKGRLVVLAGPSGVGKSSIVMRAREIFPELWFSVSVTTRAPRPGEHNGRDYHFISAEEFDHMIANDELLEWANIHQGLHRSGTPRAPIAARLAEGKSALVEVDLHGARTLRKTAPDALLVFLAPPSWEVLAGRLVGRGTEPSEVIERRLTTAREELAAQHEFDVVITNHDVQRSAEELVTLLTSRESIPGRESTAGAME